MLLTAAMTVRRLSSFLVTTSISCSSTSASLPPLLCTRSVACRQISSSAPFHASWLNVPVLVSTLPSSSANSSDSAVAVDL